MTGVIRRTTAGALLAVVAIICTSATAFGRNYISIIFDDLGNSVEHADAVLSIPGDITLAILPHTAHGASISHRAVAAGREVMLHLPMQSVEHHHLSAGTLTLHMTPAAFRRQLRSNLDSIPNISGLNNHMGSLLTRHPGYMDMLMEELAAQGDLYFVDSRTTEKSVAARFADRYRIPNRSRDIFLDPDFHTETIQRQFQRLIDEAVTGGSAIGIAHPHPHTIQFIKENIGILEEHDIELVPVSRLINEQNSKEAESDVACTGTACAGL